MKKLLLAAALSCAVPALAFAQSYSSPIFAGMTLLSPLAVSSGGTGATTSTGSGPVVLGTSPTLTTPNLGTPSAVNLTNATALPASGLAAIASENLLANPTGSSAAPSATTATSFFDNAYCSTVGYMLVRFTGVWTCAKGTPANPVWWGADPTGTTSSTTAFNSAVAASGSVLFPPGTFLFSTAPSTISASETIQGSGTGQTNLKVGYATGDFLHLTGASSNVGNFNVETSVTRTSGAYIDVDASTVNVSNITSSGAYIGEIFSANATLSIGDGLDNQNLTPATTQPGGAGVVVGTAGTADDPQSVFLSNIIQNSAGGTADPSYGIDFVSSDSAVLTSFQIINAATAAIEMNPSGTSSLVIHTMISNGFADTSQQSLQIDPSGTASVDATWITNVWLGDSVQYGALIQNGGTGSVDGFNCSQCHFDADGAGGLQINYAGVVDVAVSSSCFATDVVGVGSVANVGDVRLSNNKFGNCDGLSTNSTSDIFFTAGTGAHWQIANNRLSSATPITGATTITGGHNWFIGNDGYNPVGNVTTPSMPASGATITNPFPFPVTVYLYGSVPNVYIGGALTYGISGAGGTYNLGVGQTIELTYSSAPSWLWFGN